MVVEAFGVAIFIKVSFQVPKSVEPILAEQLIVAAAALTVIGELTVLAEEHFVSMELSSQAKANQF
jgi:hypothetical protein